MYIYGTEVWTILIKQPPDTALPDPHLHQQHQGARKEEQQWLENIIFSGRVKKFLRTEVHQYQDM